MSMKSELLKRLASKDNQAALQALEEADKLGWLRPESHLFEKANLAGANLARAHFGRISLWKPLMENVVLTQATLKETVIIEADLRGANLVEADLEGITLVYSNLETADLSRAICRRINGSGTNFSRATLTGTDFVHAQLSGAIFRGCDLRNTDLSDTYLLTADLLDSKISDGQLTHVFGLRGAILPDGTRYDGRFRLSGDLEIAASIGLNIDDPGTMARWYAGVPTLSA